MQYRFEPGFSTDYPFPHLIVDDSIPHELMLSDHPLVELSDDWLEEVQSGYSAVPARIQARPILKEWYAANTTLRCSPYWLDKGVFNGEVIFAFATKDQAFRFKMVFDG